MGGVTVRHARVVLCVIAILAMSAAVFAAQAHGAEAGKSPAKKVDPALVQVEDVPGLPRVLLIGDSISMGYTPAVRDLLKGKANVLHPPENCSSTVVGLKRLDAWLGEKKWDVIHFNFGLHDLKYIVDEKGTMGTVENGKQWVPLEEYEKNLRQIVERLKKTGAKLIWCSTTSVPEGAAGRVPGDEVKYNQAAAKVMAESGVETDDLYAVAAKAKDIQQPKNVHFTGEGYKQLAAVVVAKVEKAMAK